MTTKEGDILDSELVSRKTGKKYILKNGSIVEAVKFVDLDRQRKKLK